MDRYDEPAEAQEYDNLLAEWRRNSEDGADDLVVCSECQEYEVSSPDDLCGECLASKAEWYYELNQYREGRD